MNANTTAPMPRKSHFPAEEEGPFEDGGRPDLTKPPEIR